MFITIINDCTDANVIGRQGTRVASLFGVAPTYVGVGGSLSTNNDHDPAEFEAAGCLVDALDAAEGREGVMLVNVANRHGKGKKWPNGTPFAYFYVGKTLVVSSIDGLTLSLVKKLKLVDNVYLMDIPTVVKHVQEQNIITHDLKEHIIHTQFRSFEFVPRVAKWLTDGIEIPSEPYAISHMPYAPQCIWYVDNFGNTKTTILPEDIDFSPGKQIEILSLSSQERVGVRCYSRLKDVPNGEAALIIGSSGYGHQRFLEFVVQGQSASKIYNLHPGSKLEII